MPLEVPKPPTLPPLPEPSRSTRPDFAQEALPPMPQLAKSGRAAPQPVGAVAQIAGAFLAGMTRDPAVQKQVIVAAQRAADAFQRRQELYEADAEDRAKLEYQAKLTERNAIRVSNRQAAIDEVTAQHLRDQDRREAANLAYEKAKTEYSMRMTELEYLEKQGLISAEEKLRKAQTLDANLNAAKTFVEIVGEAGAGRAGGTRGAGGGTAGAGLKISPVDAAPDPNALQRDPEWMRANQQIDTILRLKAANAASPEQLALLPKLEQARHDRAVALGTEKLDITSESVAGHLGEAPESLTDLSAVKDFTETLDPGTRALFNSVLSAIPDVTTSRVPTAAQEVILHHIIRKNPALETKVRDTYLNLAEQANVQPAYAVNAWDQFVDETRDVQDLPEFDRIMTVIHDAIIEEQANTPAAEPKESKKEVVEQDVLVKTPEGTKRMTPAQFYTYKRQNAAENALKARSSALKKAAPDSVEVR